VTARIMDATLWRLAQHSVRQPNCLSPKGEFSAVAEQAVFHLKSR
jgi:hypothetical protein